MREAALAAGAWGCVISGAGPSLLALCAADVAEAVKGAMVERWRSEGVESRAEHLGLQSQGSTWATLPPRE